MMDPSGPAGKGYDDMRGGPPFSRGSTLPTPKRRVTVSSSRLLRVETVAPGERWVGPREVGGTLTVWTDSPAFAAVLRLGEPASRCRPRERPHGVVGQLLEAFLGRGPYFQGAPAPFPWELVLLAEHAPRSNYDVFLELARNRTPLPSFTAAVAGSGSGFHGYRGRPWAALPGNLHLSVYLAPERTLERFEVAFTVLAALSVVEALDGVPGLAGRAGLKWVNDVVVGGAKVAGVLAYTQTQDRKVSRAVLGLGVNVLTTPSIPPSPFVPAVTSVGDLLGDPDPGLFPAVFRGVLEALARNYRTLLEEGGVQTLLNRYRARSVVLGREVTVCPEDSDGTLEVLASGRLVALGDGLELYLEGHETPITRGRLILGSPPPLPPHSSEPGAVPAEVSLPSPGLGSGLQAEGPPQPTDLLTLGGHNHSSSSSAPLRRRTP